MNADWLAGYERGVQSGFEAGYREGVAQVCAEVHAAWTGVFSARSISRELEAQKLRQGAA